MAKGFWRRHPYLFIRPNSSWDGGKRGKRREQNESGRSSPEQRNSIRKARGIRG